MLGVNKVSVWGERQLWEQEVVMDTRYAVLHVLRISASGYFINGKMAMFMYSLPQSGEGRQGFTA